MRLTYVIAIDPWYPRLIHWNYGGLTFSQFHFLEQVADIIGSSGLLFYSLGLSYLLIAWWRLKSDVKNLNDNELGYKFLKRAFAAFSLLWAVGLSYGAWRIQDINENDNLRMYELFLKSLPKSKKEYKEVNKHLSNEFIIKKINTVVTKEDGNKEL